MNTKTSKFAIESFILNGLILYLVYRIVDKFYFSKLNELLELNKLGYRHSLIIYGDKTKFLLLILVLSLISTGLITYLYHRFKLKTERQLDSIQTSLKNITTGNYQITVEEIAELGPAYDDLYKLILALREKSEYNEQAKLQIKQTLEDISHQLKTPLASLEIIQELKVKPENPETAREIERELEKINYLISSLLKLSRLEVHEVNFNKSEHSIKEIIETSVDYLHNQITLNKLDIVLQGEDFKLESDFYWLVEAFINLIKNATDFANSKIIITMETFPAYRQVTIQDDGPGFKDKDLPKLFNRFYKADENSPGVGIGLNLAKTILERHTATIQAQNHEGGCFIIRFYY